MSIQAFKAKQKEREKGNPIFDISNIGTYSTRSAKWLVAVLVCYFSLTLHFQTVMFR